MTCWHLLAVLISHLKYKCEIKTVSRCQQVTVNNAVIAIEPNHLNGWFIQERNTIMLLKDAKLC